ncbi:MAG: YfiT family bacillithiol transferase [Acidobacteriota bacterium]
MSEDLRYPLGQFDRNFDTSTEARQRRIRTIAELPKLIAEAVAGLTETQFETPYRPDGWTVRQTVHHVADSHANAFIRFKLALTEDETPTIKPYYEDRWAELGDSRLPVEVSLKMLEALHYRWLTLLNSMSEFDFAKTFIHPETGEWTLEGALALYSWHSKHHTAHITQLREREGW